MERMDWGHEMNKQLNEKDALDILQRKETIYLLLRITIND